MDIRDMQTQVDHWIGQFEEGYFPPAVMIMRLAEELGELSREVNHSFGPKTKKPGEPEGSIAMELGDLLFVIISFANALDIDLEQAFRAVMDKYAVRDKMRWTLRSAEFPKDSEDGVPGST